MNSVPGPGKSTVLVLQLAACPHDAEAWEQFVSRYSGVIYQWCVRRRLQDADARDLTQNVFATLLDELPKFDRSRARFRTWLFRIAMNRVRDWCRAPWQRRRMGTAGARRVLDSAPGRRDLIASLNEEFDLELLEVAECNAQLKVSAAAWAAYQLRCKEGLSLRQAAERVGIPAGHVSKYALRVRELVARHITDLERQCGTKGGQRGRTPHDGLSAAREMA